MPGISHLLRGVLQILSATMIRGVSHEHIPERCSADNKPAIGLLMIRQGRQQCYAIGSLVRELIKELNVTQVVTQSVPFT